MDDRIEKTIDLKAPIDRVWCAVTDHKEFGTRLTIIESGFAALPDNADAAEALRRNAGDGYLRDGNLRETEKPCSTTGVQFVFKVRANF